MLSKKELLSLLSGLDDEDYKVLIIQSLMSSLRDETQKDLSRNLYYKYNHVDKPVVVKSLITGDVVTLANAYDFQQYLAKKGYSTLIASVRHAVETRGVICNHEVLDNNKNDYFSFEE